MMAWEIVLAAKLHSYARPFSKYEGTQRSQGKDLESRLLHQHWLT